MAKAPAAKKDILPQTSEAELLDRFKDYPAIDVIERRFTDPNDPGSLPILLKDEPKYCCMNTDHQRQLKPGAVKCHLCKLPARKWHIHTCNTDIQGRWAQMKSKGYVPVLVKELQDTEDVSDLVKKTEDTGEIYVRRGDRGKEITMKQPLELYNYIKAQQARRRKASSNAKAFRTELAERAANAKDELGRDADEAAETIYRGGIRLDTMTRSKTTLEEEAEGT